MEIEYSASWICVFTAQISSPSSPAVCWRPLQQRLQHLKFIIVTAETRNSIPGHPFSLLHPSLLVITALHTLSASQSTCFILSLTPSPRWSPVLCGISQSSHFHHHPWPGFLRAFSSHLSLPRPCLSFILLPVHTY